MSGIRAKSLRQLLDYEALRHQAGHGSGAGRLIAEKDLEEGAVSGTKLADRSILPSKLTKYIFRNIQITGTPQAHQTLTFAGLGAPDEGGTMPAFTAAPRVNVTAHRTECRVIVASVSTTQVELYAVIVGGDSTAYCDIEITDMGLAI